MERKELQSALPDEKDVAGALQVAKRQPSSLDQLIVVLAQDPRLGSQKTATDFDSSDCFLLYYLRILIQPAGVNRPS